MSHEASTWVWSQDLPAGAKLVLLAVADHADKTGFCWPGVEGLADKCKVSERTVWRQISELEKMGVLCRMRRSSQTGRRSNSYQIHINSQCQFCNMTISVPQPDTTDTSNVTPVSGCIKEKESSIESPVESSREGEAPPAVIKAPEYWVDLQALPHFKRTIDECEGWRTEHGVDLQRANQVAASIVSKWPGNAKSPWKDPWALFRNWTQSAPLGGSSQPHPARTADDLDKGWRQ